jgi:hypothetical protein
MVVEEIAVYFEDAPKLSRHRKDDGYIESASRLGSSCD